MADHDMVESMDESSSVPSDIVQTMAEKTWACIAAPVSKHGLFDQIFPDREALFDSVDAAPLEFCPGLLQAMQSPSPPDTSFFLGLPSDHVGRWSIYSLVLEKPGATPYVYIGSGTSAVGGVRTRWNEYDRKARLPQYVKAAFDDGYKIVSKGLLVWCPIPSAADVPCLRILFVAMEAALAFVFWTMLSQSKDYGMLGICPWPKDTFRYRSLYSHNPMWEGIKGDFDLSAEQLEEMAVAIKEKTRVYMHAYMPEYHQRARLKDGYHEQQRRNAERFRKNSYEKYLAKFARYSEKQKESNAFYCELCDHASTKPYEHNRHLDSKRHLKKASRDPLAPPARKKSRVTAETNKASKKFLCDLCDVSCTSLYELNRHNGSKRHLAKSAKAAESSTSSA